MFYFQKENQLVVIRMDPIKDMIKKKSKESKRTKEERLAEQLQLVAGFSDDGREMVTLQQLLQLKIALLAEISKEQQNKLTIERIKAQKEFKIAFLEDSITKELDKDGAIEQINKGSKIGEQLVRIEMRAIQFAFKEAKK